MNRAAQGVVLLLVGGALLRTSLTDVYLRYVREGMRPLLIAAGLVLVAIAVATLLPEFTNRGTRSAESPDPDPGPPERVPKSGPREPEPESGSPEYSSPESGTTESGSPGPGTVPGESGRAPVSARLPGHAVPAAGDPHGGHPEPAVSWLMLLPVLGLLLVVPPALGSDAANRGGTAIGSAEASDYPPLPAGDPARIPVLDYAARAVFEDGASLRDRRVELSGFIVVGRDGHRFLARMILSCCAADARPIKVGLAGAVGPLSQETWVRVVGRYSGQVLVDRVNGETIPFLDVESVTRIPAPKNPYE